VISRSHLIYQQLYRPIGFGHDDVDVAVIIDVAERRATADAGDTKDQAAFGRDLAKCLALVVKELVPLPVREGFAPFANRSLVPRRSPRTSPAGRHCRNRTPACRNL
jgi:hypothetical protein